MEHNLTPCPGRYYDTFGSAVPSDPRRCAPRRRLPHFIGELARRSTTRPRPLNHDFDDGHAV